MKMLDTTIETQKKYDELWQKLSAEERFLKGLKLIDLSHKMLRAGFKARFPQLTKTQLNKKMIEQLFNSSTF